MNNYNISGRKIVVAAAALIVTASAGELFSNSDFRLIEPAFAEESGGSDGGKGNQGGQGSGGKGAQSGQSNQGGKGTGQGGPSADSDSKGPHAGGPSSAGSAGGKPVWAQEGLPEVELGRLSVARSPDQVLDRALAEALATYSPEMETFYEMTVDEMVVELSLNWDEVALYDSPLQNLALMEDLLEDGDTQLPVENSSETLLAAFLGLASDKTIPVTTDTVVAVTTILGYPVTGDAAAALAADAEAIRVAVLAGHG